jgi:hypothetical protein
MLTIGRNLSSLALSLAFAAMFFPRHAAAQERRLVHLRIQCVGEGRDVCEEAANKEKEFARTLQGRVRPHLLFVPAKPGDHCGVLEVKIKNAGSGWIGTFTVYRYQPGCTEDPVPDSLKGRVDLGAVSEATHHDFAVKACGKMERFFDDKPDYLQQLARTLHNAIPVGVDADLKSSADGSAHFDARVVIAPLEAGETIDESQVFARATYNMRDANGTTGPVVVRLNGFKCVPAHGGLVIIAKSAKIVEEIRAKDDDPGRDPSDQENKQFRDTKHNLIYFFRQGGVGSCDADLISQAAEAPRLEANRR